MEISNLHSAHITNNILNMNVIHQLVTGVGMQFHTEPYQVTLIPHPKWEQSYWKLTQYSHIVGSHWSQNLPLID